MTTQLGLVLLSGGLDSTTVAAMAVREGYDLSAVTVHYGQAHAREVESARQVAGALGIKQRVVGFEMPDGTLPEEANQIVRPGKGVIGLEILGRITSVRYSPTLNKVIGLCWLPRKWPPK